MAPLPQASVDYTMERLKHHSLDGIEFVQFDESAGDRVLFAFERPDLMSLRRRSHLLAQVAPEADRQAAAPTTLSFDDLERMLADGRLDYLGGEGHLSILVERNLGRPELKEAMEALKGLSAKVFAATDSRPDYARHLLIEIHKALPGMSVDTVRQLAEMNIDGIARLEKSLRDASAADFDLEGLVSDAAVARPNFR